MEQQGNYFAVNEIDLRAVFNYVLKRKKTLLFIAIGSMVIALVISYFLPAAKKRYEASLMIEPAIIGMQENGEPRYMGVSEILKSKIEEGAFNNEILQGLNFDPTNTTLFFKVNQSKKSHLITITADSSADSSLSGNSLKALFEIFLRINKGTLNSIRESIDYEISSKRIAQAKNVSKIKFKGNAIKDMDGPEKRLTDEYKSILTNIDKTFNAISLLAPRENELTFNASTLYVTTSQQNFAFLDLLNERLFKLVEKKELLQTEIGNIEIDNRSIETEIQELELKKDSLSLPKIIVASPVHCIESVTNKKTISLCAFLVLFLLGAYVVFLSGFQAKGLKKL